MDEATTVYIGYNIIAIIDEEVAVGIVAYESPRDERVMGI